MDIKDIKLPKSTRELVAAVRVIYPKHDKYLFSKAIRPDQYGVVLRPDAMQAVCAELGISPEAETPQTAPKPPRTPKADNRTLPCRISCRLSKSDYSALQQHIKADGFNTTQDWLADYVRRYNKRKNVAAQKRCGAENERSTS